MCNITSGADVIKAQKGQIQIHRTLSSAGMVWAGGGCGAMPHLHLPVMGTLRDAAGSGEHGHAGQLLPGWEIRRDGCRRALGA